MNARQCVQFATRGMAAGFGLAALSYIAYIGVAWVRFGSVKTLEEQEQDSVLDRFMPIYDIAERHQVLIAAPAKIALISAYQIDLQQSSIVRCIFKARDLILRSKGDETARSRGLLTQMKALGWGILAESPGREIIMGAVCRPWLPDVTFRAVSPEEFAAFKDPGLVKIVWTLRADPVGDADSVFRTETRAAATDASARAKFRWYWAKASPGIVLLRWMLLRAIKAEAELRASAPVLGQRESSGRRVQGK